MPLAVNGCLIRSFPEHKSGLAATRRTSIDSSTIRWTQCSTVTRLETRDLHPFRHPDMSESQQLCFLSLLGDGQALRARCQLAATPQRVEEVNDLECFESLRRSWRVQTHGLADFERAGLALGLMCSLVQLADNNMGCCWAASVAACSVHCISHNLRSKPCLEPSNDYCSCSRSPCAACCFHSEAWQWLNSMVVSNRSGQGLQLRHPVLPPLSPILFCRQRPTFDVASLHSRIMFRVPAALTGSKHLFLAIYPV